MRSIRPAAAVVLLSLCSAVQADSLSDYLALVVGSFDSSAQASRDDRYDNAIWHTAEIWSDDDAVRWTYTENWLENTDAPYRQRINRYSLTEDGSILAESFPVPDAQKFIGAWNDPDRFDSLTPVAHIDPLCPARIARTGPQRFEGGTSGQACNNAYRGASYMVSRSVADADGVSNWDRGFNAEGEQVWGPVSGPYRFTRQGENTCSEPVLMLVHGEILDRSKFGAYIQALGSSGLYPKNNGYYRAISPVIDTFEGSPPANRGVVLARFPCLEAARGFWNSDEYQEIKKLRKDSSRFEVTVLRELPIPDYVNW
jgi:uncharacterized protein (DUF1330 family)